MCEDRRFLGVDSSSQVVCHQAEDAFPDWSDAVTVRNHLVVGNQDPRLDAAILQLNAPLQCPEVVAKVQFSRGSVTCKNAKSPWVEVDFPLNLLRTLNCFANRGGADLTVALRDSDFLLLCI